MTQQQEEPRSIKKRQQQPDYYPARLPSATPGDPRKVSFLISGREDKRASAQGQVLTLFLKHRVRIISQWGYPADDDREFILCLYCDMKNADITPDGLLLELRSIRSVRYARSVSMKDRLFDGFFFPMTFLENRVIVFDSQITFLLERELCKTTELATKFVEVGRIYALDIVRQIRSILSGASEYVLRENVLEYFKAAGIGRFSLLEGDSRSLQVIVRDPPLSERGEGTGNHFIHGIVVGLIETFLGRETIVIEDLYDAKSGRLFLSLLDKKNALPSEKESESLKLKALEEVEKVITAIDAMDPVTPPLASPSPTLNEVLKSYEKEGWIGGKIGYAPLKENSNAVVVKYEDGHAIEEKAVQPADSSSSLTHTIEQKGQTSETKLEIKSPHRQLQKKNIEKGQDQLSDFYDLLESALREDDDSSIFSSDDSYYLF